MPVDGNRVSNNNVLLCRIYGMQQAMTCFIHFFHCCSRFFSFINQLNATWNFLSRSSQGPDQLLIILRNFLSRSFQGQNQISRRNKFVFRCGNAHPSSITNGSHSFDWSGLFKADWDRDQAEFALSTDGASSISSSQRKRSKMNSQVRQLLEVVLLMWTTTASNKLTFFIQTFS